MIAVGGPCVIQELSDEGRRERLSQKGEKIVQKEGRGG